VKGSEVGGSEVGIQQWGQEVDTFIEALEQARRMLV